MTRPIGIDLFAGAGGMSLGFEQAGFDVLAAVEIDPIHAAIHKFNFPDCAVLPTSVRDLSGADIRRRAGIGDRKVSVVFGGAPCQGFSVIGQRALDDPRNGLVRDFVRLVQELDADYFVFENVKGITQGQHVQFLHELIEAFAACGYQTRLPWRVLNAMEFGVPQNRQRLILMGCKAGLSLPRYPDAEFGRTSATLAPTPTCADALGDIPDAEMFPELRFGDSARVEWGVPSEYAKTLKCASPKDYGFGYKRRWDPNLLTSSARTDHSAISRRRFASTEQGAVEPISRFFKLPAQGVSNTLRAGTDNARGAFTSPRPIHYLFPRCITVREMARLHGFPDWFRFHVTKWHGARQIGNAVPPPMARAVAAKVMEASGHRPSRPVKVLPLGDENLLCMDMGAASSHFGIDVPIQRRDKKGAPKRRQWDETQGMAAE